MSQRANQGWTAQEMLKEASSGLFWEVVISSPRGPVLPASPWPLETSTAIRLCSVPRLRALPRHVSRIDVQLDATKRAAVTFPMDITKTRMQIHGEIARHSKTPMPHRGMFATMVGIVREEGLLRLWKGLPPAVLRQVFYSGIRIPLYELIRSQLKRNPDGTFALYKAVISGSLSGAIAQFIASPTDLVKVRDDRR